MKLLFKELEIGKIQEEVGDPPWHCGAFSANKECKEMCSFLMRFTDEDNDLSDIPEDDERLNPENWIIIDDSGNLIQIDFPALHSDDSIYWRKR